MRHAKIKIKMSLKKIELMRGWNEQNKQAYTFKLGECP